MTRLKILFFSALIIIAACSAARAVGDVPQVNLILDHGVVLIYKGADQGFRPGDYLDVVRGGEVVGRLQVLEVFPTFTRARILPQEKTIEVFDIVTPSAPGSVTEKPDKKPEKPEKEKDDDKDDKKEKKKTKKPSKKKDKDSKKKKDKTSKKKKDKDTDKEKAAKKPDTKDDKKSNTFVPVAMPDKYYNVTLGYFYLNQDIGGTAVDQPPVMGYGVDYWMRRGDGNTFLVAGYFMAKPEIRIGTTGAPVTVENDFWKFSLSYVMENLKESKGSRGSFYYGLGADYRSIELDSSGMLSSLIPADQKEETGIDFHLLLGYRFDKDSEFKGTYSVDENYYSVSFCFGMR